MGFEPTHFFQSFIPSGIKFFFKEIRLNHSATVSILYNIYHSCYYNLGLESKNILYWLVKSLIVLMYGCIVADMPV